MNKQKPQQSHIQITVRFVEKRNGKKDVFDARKILSSLNHLTHDDRLIRRTNALVLAKSLVTLRLIPRPSASSSPRR